MARFMVYFGFYDFSKLMQLTHVLLDGLDCKESTPVHQPHIRFPTTVGELAVVRTGSSLSRAVVCACVPARLALLSQSLRIQTRNPVCADVGLAQCGDTCTAAAASMIYSAAPYSVNGYGQKEGGFEKF